VIIMRSSDSIKRQIERLEELLKHKEKEKYTVANRIEKLQNTLSKARLKEELKESGMYVKIASCEGTYPDFQVKTDEGLSWISRYRIKVGKKVKITKKFYELLQQQKRKREKGKELGIERWWELPDE